MIQINRGTPNADLCALIAEYCLSHDGDMNVYRTLRKEQAHMSVISNETALKFLQLEQSINGSRPSDEILALGGIQDVCIDSLASAWHQLDEDTLQESLVKLDARMLSKILKCAVQKAKKDLLPDVIIVSGAGTTAINGTYRRCDFSGEVYHGKW